MSVKQFKLKTLADKHAEVKEVKEIKKEVKEVKKKK